MELPTWRCLPFYHKFFVFSATVNILVRWCIQRRFNSALFCFDRNSYERDRDFIAKNVSFIRDCCGSFTSRAAESRSGGKNSSSAYSARNGALLPAVWRHRSLSHRKVIVHGVEPIITSLAYVIAFSTALCCLPSSHSDRIARSVSGARLTLPRFFLVKHFAVVNAKKIKFALATGFVNSI